ncbi:large ribosomal subunit protein uL1m [Brachionichthys hirsutus]|uniref:large ribosomal subunit protein uL1m n=1 Tax=Brachionichthys hirsutus TaxID=412623 RepID=UPI0036046A4D
MATCTRTVWKVLAGCQRQLLRAGGSVYAAASQNAPRSLPGRTFASVRPVKKVKKREQKEEKKEKRVINNKDRDEPYGKTPRAPVDDVYILKYYARTIYDAEEAIDMLKGFPVLDFTPPDQPLYIDLRLDMKLEKKKKVEPFISTLLLPHPFRTETNTVVVFTEDANQAKFALENGAVFAGGEELVEKILDDDISADYYVAVPEVLPKIFPLKNKLRKKFPKNSRGSVGIHILKMLDLFKTCHVFTVDSECYVRTQIATLNMPKEHILANMKTILADVCSHRPANLGPFVERAIVSSQASEALWFKTDNLLPKPAEE